MAEPAHYGDKSFSCCSRYASAVDCEVSLPQHSDSNPVCKAIRNAGLAQNKKIYTFKHDPALHGFALVNMTGKELAAVALKDPFMRFITAAYLGMAKASNTIFEKYKSLTGGKEINDISEYLELSEFFQSTLEPVFGVNTTFFRHYSIIRISYQT